MATRVYYGPWLVNPDTLVLVWPENCDYEVDLEDCRSPAQARDWIEHLSKKGTVDVLALTGLKNALRDILGPDFDFRSTDNKPEISTSRLKELVDDAVHRGAPIEPRRDEDASMKSAPVESRPGQPIAHSIVIHGSVTNLHSGTGNQIVGFDPRGLAALAEQLHAFLPSLRFTETGGHDEATAVINELGREQDHRRAKRLADRVRTLFSRAEGPLKDIAIGVIDAELSRVTGI